MTHYHAIAGLHGYLPNMADTCESRSDAVDLLAQVHELGRRRTAQLIKDGYLELDLKRDGNEYAEVTECDDVECEQYDYTSWPLASTCEEKA